MTTIAPDRWMPVPDEAPAPPDDRFDEPAGAEAPPRSWRPGAVSRRFVRGKPTDPVWVRPALLGLLAATTFAYLWALGDSGWANSFYSAAVQAGTKSWKAFFFGSSDASNFITVDKPPASLWVMELSARLFGLSSWSILVPQALEGVAAVGLLYVTVRRWFHPAAALLAGAIFAATPVAVLMFRYNNPDALLVLLLVGAAYTTTRALEAGRTRWLLLAAALVGTGFITKMLQALLVVPAIGAVYLLAAPVPLLRRIRQLLLAGVALVVSAGWWVAAVQLTPAADRPYIGGSQNNSLLNLIFGYNGLGRLSGNESGSVGGQGGGASMWGPTGWSRMFNADFGTQISWLLPAALILLASGLWLTRRAPRTDRGRAALVLWGGWLLVTAAVFSFAQGIIHPYYTVALAPAIGAVVAVGAALAWRHRDQLVARLALAASLGATAVWSYVLFDRAPDWAPAVKVVVLVAGLAAAAAVLFRARAGRRALAAVAVLGLVGALGGSVGFAVTTVRTPHTGAIPSAGPATATGGRGGFGGPGRFAGLGGAGGPGGRGAAGGLTRPSGTNGFPPPSGAAGFTPPTGAAGFTPPAGAAGFTPPSGGTGGFPGASTGTGAGARVPGAAGGRGGGVGGILNATTPGKQVVADLQHDASHYTWAAATVSSNSAAGYQLSSGDPVMAIGGFNGTDPTPTLAQFERYVAEGKIHYFIAGGVGLGGGPGGAGGPGGSSSSGSTGTAITQWVESRSTATTVDGVTLYDLSATAG